MLFNSIEFFIFLGCVYLAYRVLPFRWQNWLLLAAGYLFYGWWDVRFLYLIAFSTTVDFSIGLLLSGQPMTARQRATASLFLLSAAALFLCPSWQALSAARDARFWSAVLTPQPLGLLVLAGTAAVLAAANLLIERLPRLPEERRRWLLILASVAVNLTFLGVFKYANFFIDSAGQALAAAGFDPLSFRLSVILPVGISFYTFQSLSYTIDVYRRRVVPTDNFWDFALFVAYFPPMVAGPIERGAHLLPQLTRPRRLRLAQSMDGVVLILLGLFKKVAIADGLARSVDSVFNSTGAVSQSDIALASVLFAIQIFCDFSGYSDIARGVSKLLGIDLLLNFNLPYLSRNPSEFWTRWHISLSSWLRDYLYIPLGGNRRGRWRTYLNLMATMMLGGLWHGAAWNFVLWGAYQGALLCAHKTWTDHGAAAWAKATGTSGVRATPAAGWRAPIATAVFFAFCCYGWLLFRAHSFEQIVTFTTQLVGLGKAGPAVIATPPISATLGVAVLILLHLADYHAVRLESFTRWQPQFQAAVYAALIFIFVMGLSNAPVQFIYFQF